MPPGTRLGRYELGRLLGAGGAGEVYEATLHGAAGFCKRVALKVLKDDTTADGQLANEARLGGLLQHPNLVEVYALEEVEGRWVCAMELIEGGSLRDLLPLPPRAVVDVGLQVCRGLQHAHDEIGLVHLDIKPSNLLIDHGAVKVADLGIAMARGFAPDGRIRGTPAYMPPEQWAGAGLDARADVWSLGVTLLELATGAASDDPAVADWLGEVAARCVAPDRSQRFGSMLELAEALAALPVEGAGLAEVLGQRSPVPDWTPRSMSATADTWTLDPSVDDRPRTNLSPAPDRFVGRAGAVRALVADLDRPGAITVKGAGGLGKTRLARRAARMWQESGLRQAWFCDLQGARTRMDVLLTVAAVLGVPVAIGAEDKLIDSLGHAIAGRSPVAMLLDNFEQVLDCADIVARWVQMAPKARLLVTSRAVLQIPGERVVDLPPLEPEEAVELLVERASERGQDVAADPNLAALARRLDGIPLALELAAGRLGLMSAGAMLERLDQRFRLLRSGQRGVSGRQATLRATLDWSWELLSETERAAFTQCGVFVGGFAVDAAEAVLDLPDGSWALDVIESLLDRSLITERDGRLRMFESARAYALEKLGDPGPAFERHGAWFARYGDPEAVRRTWLGSTVSVERARPWIEDIAAAADRAIEARRVQTARPAALAAWWVYQLQGPYGAGRQLLQRVAELEGLSPGERAGLAFALGRAADLCGDGDAAMRQFDVAADLADSDLLRAVVAAYRGVRIHRTGDLRGAAAELNRALDVLKGIEESWGSRALVLNALARIAAQGGDWELAQARLEQSVQEARTGGEAKHLAVALSNLGKIHADRGDLAKARQAYSAAIQQHLQRGEVRHEAILLGNLGLLEADRGHMEGAVEMLQGAVIRYQMIGDRRLEGTALCNLGNVSADLGRTERAEECFVEAVGIFDGVDDVVWGGIARGFLARLRMKAGELDRAAERVAEAVERTRRMPLAWASFLALQGEIKGLRGDPSALTDLEEADATMQKGQWRRDHVGVLCAWIRFDARAGDLDEARAKLARAEAVADELGMHPDSPMGREIAHARAVVEGAAA